MTEQPPLEITVGKLVLLAELRGITIKGLMDLIVAGASISPTRLRAQLSRSSVAIMIFNCFPYRGRSFGRLACHSYCFM